MHKKIALGAVCIKFMVVSILQDTIMQKALNFCSGVSVYIFVFALEALRVNDF